MYLHAHKFIYLSPTIFISVVKTTNYEVSRLDDIKLCICVDDCRHIMYLAVVFGKTHDDITKIRMNYKDRSGR